MVGADADLHRGRTRPLTCCTDLAGTGRETHCRRRQESPSWPALQAVNGLPGEDRLPRFSICRCGTTAEGQATDQDFVACA